MLRALVSRLALLAAVLCAPAAAFAQAAPGATIVQESASTPRAGVVCQAIASPAVNTANTLTFTVPSGQAFYLTSINVTGSGDSTGGAINNGRITTTNLQGTEWDFTFPAGTSAFLQIALESNANGLIKSSYGPLNVTIVSPQSTHTAYGMRACGFFAP